MNKIITPDEARQEKIKPWKNDIEALKKQIVLESQKSMAYAQIINLQLRMDMFLMAGDVDSFFITSSQILDNPLLDTKNLKVLIESWETVLPELSEDFVNKNEFVCKKVIMFLEKIRTVKLFNKKSCNKIINRLYQKKEVSDETVNELDKEKKA